MVDVRHHIPAGSAHVGVDDNHVVSGSYRASSPLFHRGHHAHLVEHCWVFALPELDSLDITMTSLM